MNEYERIWTNWVLAKHQAQSSRIEPLKLCVMGYDTYHEFLGALQIKVHGIGWNGPYRSRSGPITYDGIDIYPCANLRTGYYFGYIDDNVIL